MRTISSLFLAHVICLASGLLSDAPPARSEDTNPNKQMVGPGAQEPASPVEWYGEGVRPTDHRSPQDERSGFHVPQGFIVELVASEPDIAKPLNIAFDANGKLWLTQTVEYPYPAKENAIARDCVKTLEDTNGDGTFDRVTTFADGLNIPMGILPYQEGAIVFSIPNLLYLRDTDDDGICDQRDVILGPFDTTRDTHGMVNSLRRGDDGWIYACHGFSNQSVVRGKDGHEVRLTSGNTFRFRPDGSRIEHFTHGQVNPFGMTVDRYGNRITADCHSKPLTCIFPGAFYPSFGRPDDGLGFFPAMMDHLHGSTAISGVSLYEAESFPADYRDQIYSGNVMTSRINRDRLDRTGATMIATEVADFLTSDDPWFRPVDIQLGPDGALYVADFYNRIIGHYEVPLEHPGRDRDSGRIWRIRHQDALKLPLRVGSEKNRLESLLIECRSKNAARRQLALDALTDGVRNDETIKAKTVELATKLVHDPDPLTQVSSLWLLLRLDRLDPATLVHLLQTATPFVQAHALRAAFESSFAGTGPDSISLLLGEARRLLQSESAETSSWAAKVLSKHGDDSDTTLLVKKVAAPSPDDPMLNMRRRLALRDLVVRYPGTLSALANKELHPTERQVYRAIVLGIRSPDVVQPIIEDLAFIPSVRDSLPWIRHAVVCSDAVQLSHVIKILRKRCAEPVNDKDISTAKVFRELREVTTGRRAPDLDKWVEDFATQSLDLFRKTADEGQLPRQWITTTGPNWGFESRDAQDGQSDFRYRSSLTLGESYTGVIRSADFTADASLSFWIVGHNGAPESKDLGLNQVRLVDTATNEVLRSALPPRSDTAQLVNWDLTPWRGRRVRVEAVDGNSGSAYAWIAMGRFDLSLLNHSPLEDRWSESLTLISEYKLVSLLPQLESIVAMAVIDDGMRLRALKCVADLKGDALTGTTVAILLTRGADPALRSRCLEIATADLGSSESNPAYREVIKTLALSLPRRDQLEVARQLAANRELATWLIEAWEEGWLSTELTQDKSIETTLDSALSDDLRERLQAVKQTVAPVNENTVAMADAILNASATIVGDLKQGEAIFTKQCSACHQLGGMGAIVGPQLDGAVTRSRERLLEDILYPDRNVDKAFRTVSFLLADGSVRVGLIRSETPDSVEIVDNAGKTNRIDAKDIESRRIGGRSLMPDGHAETVGINGMVDLLSYLQAKASQTPKP